MKKTMRKKKAIPLLVLIYVLVSMLIVANCYALKYSPIITTFLGHKSFEVEEGNSQENTEYFAQTFTTEEERLLADAAAARLTATEGFVLLKNQDNTLPLASGSKVSLFGVSSADILYGGGGSGAVDTSTAPTLKSALEAGGFEVNPTLWDFYTTGAAKDIRMDVADMSGTGRYVIHEANPDLFTQTEEASFSEYGDAAIVTFARSGSESSDVPTVYDESYLQPLDIEGFMGSVHSDPLASQEDLGRHYLELTANEETLLSYVSNHFDRVIVLINSGNAMELSFLDQEAYGVDACMWIGNPGQDGLYALGDLLNGTVSPSGRTVDTYAYDPLNAPAVQNFGDCRMENAAGATHDSYVVYQEGIYVGYKYYETRYEDTVLGQGNADSAAGVSAQGAQNWDYQEEVQFPFGYGLSYTTFQQELTRAEYDSGSECYQFEVQVTNVGNVAGKEVVQLYLQSPYTDYDREFGVEKASVQLVGFDKTDTLEPGATETMKLSVPKEELKAYDANGEGTYILEAGDYYFTVAANAHDAVNNILAAKGADNLTESGDLALTAQFAVDTTDKFAHSTVTGAQISNQFTDADLRTYDPSFVYLTRSDWEGTWPEPYQLTATPEMVEALAIPEGTDDETAQMPVTGADNGLTLAMVKDLDASDPTWDSLLDQLTAEEMYNLVRVGGYQTQPVNSVSAPATICVDGPAYVGNAGTTGVTRPEATYAWCSEVVISSTWNREMAEIMGQLIGEDCLAQGDLNFAGWYAPAMNIHRTAFSGRNFEYYSEDGYLSGQFGLATVSGARSKGVITFVKHFALNDQETNRSGVSTFSNEQAIREIYLKAFEASIADREHGTLGIMLSMNRVGLKWSGNHAGLIPQVVRGEWGFDGMTITDQASYPDAFPALAIRGGLEGGTDLWLNTGSDNWQIDGYQNNPTVMTQLRNASRHILYAVSQSFAMNGIAADTHVVQVLPQWQIWMFALDAVCGVLAIVAVVRIVRKTSWKNSVKNG